MRAFRYPGQAMSAPGCPFAAKGGAVGFVASQEFVDPTVNTTEAGQSIAVPFSWVVEATTGPDLSGSSFVAQLNDGTTGFRVLLYNNGGDLRMQARQSSANAADFSIGALTINTPFRVAVRWASGDFGGSLDGATAVTAGGAFTATTYTTYQFGSPAWGGTIQLVREFNGSAFTDSELQSLSA